MPRLAAAQVPELRQRAPYSSQLAAEAVRARGNESYEAIRDEYGDLAAYHLELARAVANAAWHRPEISVPQMERVCAMNADKGYWDLAPYLVDRGRVDEGRRAFERWLAVGRSEVAISNSMMWMVRDYHERGERAKATALADRVADAGSFWGLVTRANLHDWRGELDAAERLHRRARQRYDNPNELLGFYLRHGRKGSDVLELTREIFPEGMTRASAGALDAAPRDGVTVVTAGVIGATDGVKAGDVIVAVDGIRVRSVAQYRAARGASAGDAMQLTVWRRDRYIDVPTRLRHRWIVSSLETYQPGRDGARTG
jgi:PDZ domain